ncbi:uncharacterized protein TNCV_1607021 [Trichonephila clavipes]|nr:uncharacterized protein TNCV_1607021 [Trichonephila clavipes]
MATMMIDHCRRFRRCCRVKGGHLKGRCERNTTSAKRRAMMEGTMGEASFVDLTSIIADSTFVCKDTLKAVSVSCRLEAFTSEKTVSKDTSVTEIEIKPKKIEQLQINLDKIAQDYCEIETFESLEIIQLDIEDINQRIETTEVSLKLLMYSLKNSENVNINLNDNGKNSIPLPQIPLPEFSGVIAEFSNYKNQFINLISNNEQLNDSQKLYYLRASLKGEAKLLESPSDSFDTLFKALEDRYENKRQLIDSHVLEIINYEKIYSESAKELRALMDCINRNIRALKVLKYEQNDLSDIILINIILQKIDKESRKTIRTFVENSRSSNI